MINFCEDIILFTNLVELFPELGKSDAINEY